MSLVTFVRVLERFGLRLHRKDRAWSDAQELFRQPFQQSIKYAGSPACRHYDKAGIELGSEIRDDPRRGPEMKLASAMGIQGQRLRRKMLELGARVFGILLKEFRWILPARGPARQRLDHVDEYDFAQVLAGKRDTILKRGERI